MPKHANSKRIYPFWKICVICLIPFQTFTKEQALRNKCCSKECKIKRLSLIKTGIKKHPPLICKNCGKEFYAKSHPERAITCGIKCRDQWRFRNQTSRAKMKIIGAMGRLGWTEESEKSFLEKMTGEKNPAWKGGITYSRSRGNYKGARYVKCPDEFISMARKDGYVMEHRLVMAMSIKRNLLRSEVVHHINHDSLDNRLENLMLFKNNSEHKQYESQDQK